MLIIIIPSSEKVHAVNVTGNITVNTTWNAAGSPYIITGSVTVLNGVTLTIDTSGGPVQVRAGGNYGIYVDNGGTINAIGTPTNKITFTHNTATALSSWIGIRVAAGGVLNLGQCNFNYAGYAVNANGGIVNVSDCTFTTNLVGLSANNQGTATSARNTFLKNTYPLSMEWDSTLNLGQGADVDIIGTSTNQNTYNAIVVGLYNNYAYCVSNICTISKKNFAGITNIPYVIISDNIAFDGVGDVLNVDPGVIIKLALNRYILVRSTSIFNVNGTTLEPVYFTSIHDDTIGGDTNNNGTATSPTSNYWEMVRIESTGGTSTIDNAIVRYSKEGLLSYGLNTSLIVSDTLFDNNTSALGAYNQGTTTSVRNTFYKNSYPLGMEWDSTLNLGQGADIDIIGTGGNLNTYHAIAVGTYQNDANCVNDSCTVSKKNFAGITNIPYVIVVQNIQLTNINDVINIDPGVIIKLGIYRYIIAQSNVALHVNGTALEPVYFTSIHDDTIGGDTNNNGTATSPTSNYWEMVRIDSPNVASTIDYAVVKYSKEGLLSYGLNTNLTVSDTFFDNNTSALGAYNQGTTTSVRNTFYRNTYPVGMEWDSTLNLGQGADVDIIGTGGNINSFHGIAVGTYQNDLICTNDICTISKKDFAGITNIPYMLITNNIYFPNANDVITFNPGVVIKLAAGRTISMTSNTVTTANGTTLEPIYFTSIHDDTIGGDTNNNGSATAPSRGVWDSITTTSTGNLSLSYVNIRYANTAAVVNGSGIHLDINNSTLYSNNYGVVARGNGSADTHSNTYLRNYFPVSMDFDSFMTFGEGATVDTFGSGVDKNDYNAIVVNPYNNGFICLNNTCNIVKKNFAGITNIPYVLRYNISFNNVDDVINVDPGVIIKSTGPMIIMGSNAILNINGLQNERVYLISLYDDTIGGDTNNDGSSTSPTKTNGPGISNGTTGTVNISYAEIRSANLGVVAAGAGTTTIVSDTIFNYNNYAFASRSNATVTSLRNTYIRNYFPVALEFDSFFNFGAGANIDIIGSGVDKNDYNGIAVNPYNVGFICIADVCNILKKNFAGIEGIPYVLIYNSNFANANDVVNIDPGVVIKSGSSGIILSSNAVLNVNGQSGQMVYFTSLHDDSIGGDTNNNGTATTPARGQWNGLTKSSTGAATFTFSNIKYAANGLYSTAGTLNIADSNFYINTTGLYVVMSTSPTLQRINFEGNYSYALRNGNATVVNAQNLWWGNVGGPNDADATGQCPSNVTTGDIVTDSTAFPVAYCPYSTSKFVFNQVPLVTNVQINNGASSISLLAGTQTPVVCSATVIDDDGYEDIQFVTAKFYRTGVGIGATDHVNNHYTVSGNTSCVPSGGSGTSETYTCTLNVYYLANATDVGSTFEADDWSCSLYANDGKSESTAVSATIEMNSMVGVNVTPNIAYGSVNPGSNTASFNPTTAVSNVGNTVIDLTVAGVDMCSDFPTCSQDILAVGHQRFGIATFNYSSGVILSSSPFAIDANLAAATADPSNQIFTIYWGIEIPSNQQKGVYTGQNTITANQSL